MSEAGQRKRGSGHGRRLKSNLYYDLLHLLSSAKNRQGKMTVDTNVKEKSIRLCTSDIVSAYVSNNAIQPDEVVKFIGKISSALSTIPEGGTPVVKEPKIRPNPLPASKIASSVSNSRIVCLECGESFKSLKRHLMAAHGLSAVDYRDKWDLPIDYPLVCKDYAKLRSEIAKKTDLGKKPTQKQ